MSGFLIMAPKIINVTNNTFFKMFAQNNERCEGWVMVN